MTPRSFSRTHSNGWIASVVMYDDGDYSAGAGLPGTVQSSARNIRTFDEAKRAADREVPAHDCSPSTCPQWPSDHETASH
jgi:hypothetical protein